MLDFMLFNIIILISTWIENIFKSINKWVGMLILTCAANYGAFQTRKHFQNSDSFFQVHSSGNCFIKVYIIGLNKLKFDNSLGIII